MTELADNIAAKVRIWYEEHREHWLTRMGEGSTKPDEFMLALVAECERVIKELTPVPHVLPPPPVHRQEAHKKMGRK
jgi:hypothetical protein